MGIDIHVTVVARKNQDSEHPEQTYRALEFQKKGQNYPFRFPYFRNSFFFGFLQDNTTDEKWKVVKGNVEQEEAIEWYNETGKDSYLWGHSYIKLKDLMEIITDIEFDIHRYEKSEDTEFFGRYGCETQEDLEEILGCLKYMYNSAKLMMDFDVMLEDRLTLEYDIDNTILLIAYDH